jgi:hypothetical protein
MENFAKPSVLKNHKNSFNSSIKAIRELIDNLSSEYSRVTENISAYSDKRKNLIQSLENLFKKYNLEYKAPLIQNDLNEIINYAKELESQLDISLASLDGDKKKSVIDDSLSIPSEITQIEIISDKVEKSGKRLEELEKELSMIRIPEKDSKEEKVINFNDLLKKKNETKEVDKDNSKVISISDLSDDNISSDIFNEEEKDAEELSEYINSLMSEDENVVKVDFKNNSSSLSDKVEAVYGDSDLWDKIYNYNENNKEVIDNKAFELGKSPEEVVNDKTALMGESIDFPTELDLIEEENERRLG